MEIIPAPDTIYLDFPQVAAGVLDTSSRASANEVATVIAVGEGVTQVKTGDRVFVKSFGVDTITWEDKTYRFCNIKTGALLAVVR